MSRPTTLIGFSGCGKSYFARQLATGHGFTHIECDARIEEKLESSLPVDGSGTQRLAAWLGQPYDVGFSGRQQRYFFAEQEVMQEIVTDLDSGADRAPTVIDTTGSIIYVERPVLDELRRLSTIVYLKMEADDEQAMFEQYLRDPKPVIWQNVYRPEPSESREEALRRCYHALMTQRAELYELFADLVIPVPYSARASFSALETLRRIEQHRHSLGKKEDPV